jgi:cytochrome bd-type quinol oxidase subunit 2
MKKYVIIVITFGIVACSILFALQRDNITWEKDFFSIALGLTMIILGIFWNKYPLVKCQKD